MDSKEWYRRHTRDAFVSKAQIEGFRSRAAYKLLEIHQKTKLFHRATNIIDIGAAPGSWTQVAARLAPADCRIIALDRIAMKPVTDVKIIQGDIREQSIRDELSEHLCGSKADVILSDMAPNLSGISSVDQLAASALTEIVFDCCQQWLDPYGTLVLKTFHGGEFQRMTRLLKEQFVQVRTIKPKASRPNSQEVFLYAKLLASV